MVSASSLIRPHERPARPTPPERRRQGKGPNGGAFSTADRIAPEAPEGKTVGTLAELDVLAWQTEEVRVYAINATTGQPETEYYLDVERVTRAVLRDPVTGRRFAFLPPWGQTLPGEGIDL